MFVLLSGIYYNIGHIFKYLLSYRCVLWKGGKRSYRNLRYLPYISPPGSEFLWHLCTIYQFFQPESIDVWVCVCVCVCVHVCACSHIWLFMIQQTVALQIPLSIEFSRQEYWSGLPFPSAEDLPNSGMESQSPVLAEGLLTTESPGKPWNYIHFTIYHI